MEIIKYKSSQVMAHIRHDLRDYPSGKKASNKSIDSNLISSNYSLLSRGDAVQTNAYRKAYEKEIFKYNRKNLVHAVEVVIQAPDDLAEEQREVFFKESFQWLISTLPAGEDCVLLAEVHRDEKHYSPGGEMISKEHLHVMYIPAVLDTQHEGYEYKLCADALTKRSQLKRMHPGLQKHLDNAGIKCSVVKKKETDGKTIGLTVKQLKEITKKTGVKLEKSLTVDELSSLIFENKELKHQLSNEIEMNKALSKRVAELEELHAKALEALANIQNEREQSVKTKDWDFSW